MRECISCFSYESGTFVCVNSGSSGDSSILRWHCWACTRFEFLRLNVFCLLSGFDVLILILQPLLFDVFVVNYCSLRAIVGEWPGFFILSLLFLLLFLHDIFHLTIAIEVILYSCVCHWSKLCDICWANGFKACKHWKYLLGYWIFCAKFAGIEFNFFPFDVVLGPLFSLLEYAMGAYSL